LKLSLHQIALILDQDIIQYHKALRGLHSVLYIPTKSDASISLHHKSFGDFLFDSKHSGKFYIDKRVYAAEVIELCLIKIK
ncbi:hypothetical protein AX16_010095, partial [Volvariella volvacea WC 439]